MKPRRENFEDRKLRDVLRKVDGYAEVEKENLDELYYHTKGKIVGKDNITPVTLLFINSGIVFLERGERTHCLQFLKYDDVVDSKIYDHRSETYVKIFVKDADKNVVCSVKNKNIAQKTAMIIRTGKESRSGEAQSTSAIKKLSAIIRFGDLKVFVDWDDTEGMDAFRRKAIHRLGKHFYPDKGISEASIDIQEYSEFLFYANYSGMHVLLESHNDLKAALFFLDKKLDVLITMKGSKPQTIEMLENPYTR